VPGLEERQGHPHVVVGPCEGAGEVTDCIESDESSAPRDGFLRLRPRVVADVGQVSDTDGSKTHAERLEDVELLRSARVAAFVRHVREDGYARAEMDLGNGAEHLAFIRMHLHAAAKLAES